MPLSITQQLPSTSILVQEIPGLSHNIIHKLYQADNQYICSTPLPRGF